MSGEPGRDRERAGSGKRMSVETVSEACRAGSWQKGEREVMESRGAELGRGHGKGMSGKTGLEGRKTAQRGSESGG